MAAKIVLQHVVKSFAADEGSLQVLNDITLTVSEGETVAIVGPSGCGKSTLLSIIAGFEQADSGHIEVVGTPRNRPSPKGILISQRGSVFPWLTVRENLMFGLNGHPYSYKKALADEYAALVGLKGFENRYPYQLSGGMLKRAEIARALVVKPEILYMDEPFSALDALLTLRLREELLKILSRERPTVLLVTHDIEEALHLANRVLVLSARPTTIQATFDVPFPYPRTLSSPDVQALRVSILHELGVDSCFAECDSAA